MPELSAYAEGWITASVMMYLVARQYFVGVFIFILEVLRDMEAVNEYGFATGAVSR